MCISRAISSLVLNYAKITRSPSSSRLFFPFVNCRDKSSPGTVCLSVYSISFHTQLFLAKVRLPQKRLVYSRISPVLCETPMGRVCRDMQVENVNVKKALDNANEEGHVKSKTKERQRQSNIYSDRMAKANKESVSGTGRLSEVIGFRCSRKLFSQTE